MAIGYSAVDTCYKELKYMVQECKMPLEEALCFMTSNTARSLELYPRKGCVCVGADADLLLLDEQMDLEMVMAGGKLLMQDHVLLKKGTYEK